MLTDRACPSQACPASANAAFCPALPPPTQVFPVDATSDLVETCHHPGWLLLELTLPPTSLALSCVQLALTAHMPPLAPSCPKPALLYSPLTWDHPDSAHVVQLDLALSSLASAWNTTVNPPCLQLRLALQAPMLRLALLHCLPLGLALPAPTLTPVWAPPASVRDAALPKAQAYPAATASHLR